MHDNGDRRVMARDGFIKLHRQITEWEWYDDANTFRVWIHLILKANHKDHEWRGLTIKRGQCVCSVRTLSEELKLSPKQVRTALKHLESTQEVAIKTANKFTLVTIEKYSVFQDKSVAKGKQKGNQRATIKNEKKYKEDIYKSSVNIYPKDIGERLEAEDRDRLTDLYSNPSELIRKVNERIRARKRQTEIKDPYSYIVRAARDMEWPTVEETEKINAIRKKNLEEIAKAERPPELTPEQKAKAKEIRERRRKK